jgi:hypothetical protein
VNDVQCEYDGLGQLTKEWQNHHAEVDTGSSPVVQYLWSEMPSGANRSRLTKMTYPDGREVHHRYSTGIGKKVDVTNAIRLVHNSAP